MQLFHAQSSIRYKVIDANAELLHITINARVMALMAVIEMDLRAIRYVFSDPITYESMNFSINNVYILQYQYSLFTRGMGGLTYLT